MCVTPCCTIKVPNMTRQYSIPFHICLTCVTRTNCMPQGPLGTVPAFCLWKTLMKIWHPLIRVDLKITENLRSFYTAQGNRIFLKIILFCVHIYSIITDTQTQTYVICGSLWKFFLNTKRYKQQIKNHLYKFTIILFSMHIDPEVIVYIVLYPSFLLDISSISLPH